jgi:HAD superfamily hydrolase (TIGR01509 family)
MIKFVYFDLGGTVIKDFSGTNKWDKLKQVIGVKKSFEEEFDRMYDQFELKELCINRDVDTLIPIFTEKFGIKFPRNFSFLDYLVNNFEKNTSIWPVITEVEKNFDIGLLTNMYPRMFAAIRKRGLLPPNKWDVIIDSTIVGLQKPDGRIYELAEVKADAKGEEILFVDNTKINIEAAKIFDWRTILYNSAKSEESSRKLVEVFL